MSKKKRYATHVTMPTGERVYISAANQTELNQKVAAARVQMGAGLNLADSTTFSEYAYIWLAAYKAPPKLRQNSYNTLKANLDNHVIPFFGETPLKEIKPYHIQLFRTSLGHLSRSVQAKCLQIAAGIFRTAADNNLIIRSPMTKEDKPTAEKPEQVQPLTDFQAAMLMKAVRGTRAEPFCMLALGLGLRRGEILGLMWEDIDLEDATLYVRHSKAFSCNASPVTTLLKSDAAKRDLHLSPVLVKYLTRLKQTSKSRYVLSMDNGESLTLSSFQSLWKIIEVRTVSDKRQLGDRIPGARFANDVVSLDFHCHPHQLRHTFATQMFEHGADVKEVQYHLGHSTPEMTMRIYTHYRQSERVRETASKIDSATAYLAV